MPISDMTPDASPNVTDEMTAAKLQLLLQRSIRTARQIVGRATNLVNTSPGGKSGVNTALDTTQAEAAAILDKLVTLVNDHKATGTPDVANPLV